MVAESKKEESNFVSENATYLGILLMMMVFMLEEARHLTVFMLRPLALIRKENRSWWVIEALSAFPSSFSLLFVTEIQTMFGEVRINNSPLLSLFLLEM